MNYIFMQRIGLAYLVALGAQIVAVPRIQQIQVTQQTGSSCGYHAVYNATAVDTLALQGGQLTSAAIVQEARQYRNFIQRDAILGDTIIHLANQVGTGNLYCVNGRNGLAFAGSSQGSQEGNQFLDDVVAQRQHAYPMIGHFVVNTGGHWVTFSVVKQPGQETIILYMDSVNNPLARNRTAQAVGNALLVRLGGVAERVNAPGARGSERAAGRTGRNSDKPERNFGRAGRSSDGLERNFGRADRVGNRAERAPFGRSGRNSVKPERGFGNRRGPDSNFRQPEYVQESDYASAYDERDVPVAQMSEATGFSYKTYLAVGLVFLLIGLKS